jgi:hypothetical protein
MIIAKPIVKDRFWILKENNEKVGNIEAVSDGYTVTVNDTIAKIKSINTIKRANEFTFEPPIVTAKNTATNTVHGYASGCRAYNPLWDVKRRLPLFTKNKKSKSWFAAGWYRVQQNKLWETVQSPKLITLQRYHYQGPFHTQKEANESTS